MLHTRPKYEEESLMLMPWDGDGSAHLPTKEIKLQVLNDINLKSQHKQSITLVVIPTINQLNKTYIVPYY